MISVDYSLHELGSRQTLLRNITHAYSSQGHCGAWKIFIYLYEKQHSCIFYCLWFPIIACEWSKNGWWSVVVTEHCNSLECFLCVLVLTWRADLKQVLRRCFHANTLSAFGLGHSQSVEPVIPKFGCYSDFPAGFVIRRDIDWTSIRKSMLYYVLTFRLFLFMGMYPAV